ncbi:MAG: N-acetyltransferase family protein [Hyphomonadaceae bacterium]
MSFHFRPAWPEDAPAILGLIRELAEYEHLLHESHADEAMVREALFCDVPRVFCEVAEAEGRIVGQAIWYYTFSTFAGRHGIYLEDLYVQPAFRGQGLGKEFLVRLAQRCVAENLARLDWQVLDWNAPSIAFYESLGAKILREWLPARVSGEALQRLAGK